MGVKIAAFEPGKIKTEIYKKSSKMFDAELSTMSEDEKNLYRPLINVAKFNIKYADSMSSPVSEVVDVFLHALTSDKPKTRYPVGGDSKRQYIVGKYFPDRLRDWIIKQKIKKLSK